MLELVRQIRPECECLCGARRGGLSLYAPIATLTLEKKAPVEIGRNSAPALALLLVFSHVISKIRREGQLWFGNIKKKPESVSAV